MSNNIIFFTISSFSHLLYHLFWYWLIFNFESGSGKFNVDGVEPHRYAIVPGLRVDSQSPGAHRLVKIYGHLLILVDVGSKYHTVVYVFPNAAVFRVGNLNRRHPRRMVASALNHYSGPPLQAFSAHLNPLSELTINWCPGLRICRTVVQCVVDWSCTGEHHFSPESHCINGQFFLLVVGEVLDFLFSFETWVCGGFIFD